MNAYIKEMERFAASWVSAWSRAIFREAQPWRLQVFGLSVVLGLRIFMQSFDPASVAYESIGCVIGLVFLALGGLLLAKGIAAQNPWD